MCFLANFFPMEGKGKTSGNQDETPCIHVTELRLTERNEG